jgi:hypothetical protein
VQQPDMDELALQQQIDDAPRGISVSDLIIEERDA